MGFKRRRRFGRFRKRVARQYRSWETLFCEGNALYTTAPFESLIFPAGLLAPTPGSTLTGGMPGDEVDPLDATVIGAYPVISQSGFTQIFPLWSPWLQRMHGGQDITIKALYGYMMPIQVQQFNSSSIQQNIGQLCKVRFVLMQVEMRQEWMTRGIALNNFSVWSHADLSRHRIRWLRDWIMPYGPTNGLQFKYWNDTSGASAVSTSSGNEPLLAGLCGGPRVRFPRLNMRVTKDRPLVLAVGVAGNLSTQVQAVSTDTNFHIIQPNCELLVGVTGFLRAFLVR